MFIPLSGNLRTVSVVPVIVPAAYAANDCIGAAVLAIPGASRQDEAPAALINIRAIDKVYNNAPLKIYLYSKKPVTVPTDNSGWLPTDADSQYFLGAVAVAAGTVFGTLNSAQNAQLNPPLVFKTLSGSQRFLYAVLTTTGTPTYSTASDLTLQFDFLHPSR